MLITYRIENLPPAVNFFGFSPPRDLRNIK